jgi:fused signal recognition particle receptor
MGIFSKFSKDKKETLDKGLEKTKTSIFTKLSKAVAGKSRVDEDVLDRLEETLVSSDVGVETTLRIIERLQARAAKDKYISTGELNSLLKDEIVQLLQENNAEDTDEFSIPIDTNPYIIMVVGVNGVGKTTTIGKLAYNFRKAGKTSHRPTENLGTAGRCPHHCTEHGFRSCICRL